MPISFDGITERYQDSRIEILKAVDHVLQSGKRSRSRYVDKFEAVLEEICGGMAIGVGSGTTGLEIALRAVGVQKGDEVIVPAFSFAATAGCVCSVGATPVFVDICPNTTFIDATKLNAACSEKTKAVIAAHLFGSVNESSEILNFCRNNDIAFIEDIAQAFFSYHVSNSIFPTDVHAAVTSFDAFKVTPGLTGGGAVITKNTSISQRAKLLRCHGYDQSVDDFCITGTKSELSSIDAAALLIDFAKFPKYNRARKNISEQYSDCFARCGIQVVSSPERQPNNYHKYVLSILHRDELRNKLKNEAIPSKVHYSRALPDYMAFQVPVGNLNHDGWPHARNLASRVLSLPIHPFLTQRDVNFICRKVKELSQ